MTARRTSNALAAAFLMAASAFAQQQTGGVRGTIVDAATHQPVRKARVMLLSMRPPPDGKPHDASAITDPGGAFAFDSLPPGQYALLAQHENYPQRQEVRKTVDVVAGETAGPVTLELIPGAAVSGRVLDEDGDPLIGCGVQPHPARHPEQGVQFGTQAPNENGEYRLFGIPPGQYTFSVICGGSPFEPRPFSSGPDPPSSAAYPQQFYPLTSDAKSAQLIELAPGAERPGLDFRMRPMPVTTVRGVLSPAGMDWHGQQMILQLIPADSSTPPRSAGQTFNQEKGAFEFLQVFPGSYELTAFTVGDPGKAIAAVQRLEVKDRPVETVLTLSRGIELAGRVEVESNNTATPVSLSALSIQLIPKTPFPAGRPMSQVADDGTFTLKPVLPAKWRLILNGGSSLFVKSVWLGNTEATGQTLDLSSAGAQPLRIVVSTNTATINGTAPAGQTVFASRIDEEDFPNNARGATADASGRFTIPGIAPGKYRVYLAGPGAPLPEQGGQEITIREGETSSIDVKAPGQE